MDYDDEDEDEFDDDEDAVVVRVYSGPFSWFGLASDAALMWSTIAHAAGKFAFDVAVNLGQAHNQHVSKRNAEEFAEDVMKKVSDL